jgi:hypothetical protein
MLNHRKYLDTRYDTILRYLIEHLILIQDVTLLLDTALGLRVNRPVTLRALEPP